LRLGLTSVRKSGFELLMGYPFSWDDAFERERLNLAAFRERRLLCEQWGFQNPTRGTILCLRERFDRQAL
jgi:hypothetical protein